MSENKKNNKAWLYALGILVIISLLVVPFVLKPSSEFGGSDNKGSDYIAQISPGYTPWITNFFIPPPETESMLFAVQATIGGIFIGYFIGYVRGRSSTGKAEE